jgi:hypothetical protein
MQESAMADKHGLRNIGFVLGAFTAATIMIATFVVQGHIAGRFDLESGKPFAVAEVPTR